MTTRPTPTAATAGHGDHERTTTQVASDGLLRTTIQVASDDLGRTATLVVPGCRQCSAAPANVGRVAVAPAPPRFRRRALVAALGFAMAATILPAAAAHASPQPPTVEPQFANPGGNPQPPQPPDPPDWGPDDLANPTENPEPPQPPDPPDWGPDDLANPTENPEPPQPPNPGVDDYANPTGNPDPVPPGGDPIPTPQRVDAGFGGTAGSHQAAAGLALIAAALVLTLLVIVIARRQRANSETNQ